MTKLYENCCSVRVSSRVTRVNSDLYGEVMRGIFAEMGVFCPVRAYALPTNRAALPRHLRKSVSEHVLDKKALGNQIISINHHGRLSDTYMYIYNIYLETSRATRTSLKMLITALAVIVILAYMLSQRHVGPINLYILVSFRSG